MFRYGPGVSTMSRISRLTGWQDTCLESFRRKMKQSGRSGRSTCVTTTPNNPPRSFSLLFRHVPTGAVVSTVVKVSDDRSTVGGVYVSGGSVPIPEQSFSVLGGCSKTRIGTDQEAIEAHAADYACVVVDPYSFPSLCVCGGRLDVDGVDKRAEHRLCGRTIGDVLRPARRQSPLAPWLASEDKANAFWRSLTVADKTTHSGRQFIDVGFRADWHKERKARADSTVRPQAERRDWRSMRRAAMASLATDAPMAHAELANRGNASVELHPEGQTALRAELVAMPSSLAFLIRLEASAFDRGEWKDDDGYTRRAKRDPFGPLASATLSRVWEAAALSSGNTVASVLALTRNAARWLVLGDKRTGGAIGGKLDKANVDKAKERSRVAAGRIIDAMPARQRALIAERLADSPELLAIAERIADIQARAVDRDFTNAERLAIFTLRETIARALALT